MRKSVVMKISVKVMRAQKLHEYILVLGKRLVLERARMVGRPYLKATRNAMLTRHVTNQGEACIGVRRRNSKNSYTARSLLSTLIPLITLVQLSLSDSPGPSQELSRNKLALKVYLCHLFRTRLRITGLRVRVPSWPRIGFAQGFRLELCLVF